MQELIAFAISNPVVVILGTVTLIQVVPIKVDPWSALFEWIGSVINGDLREDIKSLQRDFELEKANTTRWNILDFANSCRNGRRHSKEEWYHVIDQLSGYERYVEDKNITNGVIEEETKYLRELYSKILKENDFLL